MSNDSSQRYDFNPNLSGGGPTTRPTSGGVCAPGPFTDFTNERNFKPPFELWLGCESLDFSSFL